MTDGEMIDQAREKVAAWMIANSFATGHGDTLDDLLGELGPQIKEREERAYKRGHNAGYAEANKEWQTAPRGNE